MNKNSAKNQTENYIYQEADRVPVDIRGGCGSAAREMEAEEKIEKPLRK